MLINTHRATDTDTRTRARSLADQLDGHELREMIMFARLAPSLDFLILFAVCVCVLPYRQFQSNA